MPSTASAKTAPPPPVVVKKYANRRLYNTESSCYITLENLAEMIRNGRDFAVYDAKTGDDITRSVLTQIIVEAENSGQHLLPTSFLRQLISFYGDSLQGLVPPYLDNAMNSFARQQEQMRRTLQQTMGELLPVGLEELGRKNMAMFEQAMNLFSPFYQPPSPAEADDQDAAAQETPEIRKLKVQIEELQRQIANLTRNQ